MERLPSLGRSLSLQRDANKHVQAFWAELESSPAGPSLPPLRDAGGSQPCTAAGSKCQEPPPQLAAGNRSLLARSRSLPAPTRRGAASLTDAALQPYGAAPGSTRRQSSQQDGDARQLTQLPGRSPTPAVLMRTASMFAPRQRGGETEPGGSSSSGSGAGSHAHLLSKLRLRLSTLEDGEEDKGGGCLETPVGERHWDGRGAGSTAAEAGAEGSTAGCCKGLDDFASLTTVSQNQHHVVYIATPSSGLDCAGPGGQVVVKVFLKSALASRTTLQHFQVEAHLLASVKHPNIIQGLGRFEDETAFFVVQAFADGRTLRSYLSYWLKRTQGRPLGGLGPVVPESEMVELVLRPLLCALACLHSQGYVHRDIKLDNLVFTREGVLKLIDFGLAVDTHAKGPVSGMVGTLPFMAPGVVAEGLLDPALADRTDVWGLGVVAFLLLCGRLPFFHESRSVLRQLVAEAEVPLEALAAVAASEAAVDFVRQALTKDPALRPTAAGVP